MLLQPRQRQCKAAEMMRQKGERWLTKRGDEIIVTEDLANGHLRVLNDNGKLEVITESVLLDCLNLADFPTKVPGRKNVST